MAGYLEQSLEKLKEFEGSIPWMYLDTVGKVTVGVGLMLPNEVAALALPFAANGEPATAAAVAQEFARVSAMKKGQLAKSYLGKLALELPLDVIDSKLRETLLGFEGYLRSNLSGYDAMPDPVKMALLDLVYNLGPGQLFVKFPRLMAAVERGDWKAAAGLSRRQGPSPERNAWVKAQFLAAAALVTLKAEAEELGGNLLLGLLSGLAAAAALAILTGELDRLAARLKHRQQQPMVR